MLKSKYKNSAENYLASFKENLFASQKLSELSTYFSLSLRKSEYLPDRMYVGDKVANSEVEKAEFFNNFFQSVFHTEVHDTLDRNRNENACNINKTELTNIQILNVLPSLDHKKACGTDKIGNKILLNFSSSLMYSLFLIFQTSLNKGVFPSVWTNGTNIGNL